MARAVYSAQLGLFHALELLQLLAVPADELWVIRTVTLFYPGSVGDSYAQLVDGGSNATLLKDEAGELSAGAYHYYNDLRIVLPAGSELLVTGGGSPDVGIFGYAFHLPPP